MPDLAITISEPVSASITAICQAIIAVCHTIDAQTAAMGEDERRVTAAARVEALKPWLALGKSINKLLGID